MYHLIGNLICYCVEEAVGEARTPLQHGLCRVVVGSSRV